MRLVPMIGIVLALSTSASASDSGVQITQQGPTVVLVQKDVGNERWAMTFSLEESSALEATGNIFRAGAAPAFVQCRPIDVLNPNAPIDRQTIVYNCYGADACPSAPCSASQWRFIATVDIPANFLLP